MIGAQSLGRRARQVRRWLGKNVLLFGGGLMSTVAAILGFTGFSWAAWGAGAAVIVGFVIHVSDRRRTAIREDKERKSLLASLFHATRATDEGAKLNQALQRDLSQRAADLLETMREHEGAASVLRQMIESGTVSLDELVATLSERNVFLIHIAASSPGVMRTNAAPGKGKYWNRWYPDLLKNEIGAVRLPVNSAVFITTEKRMPKAVDTLGELKVYLERIIGKSMQDEWQAIQDGIREGTLRPTRKTPPLDTPADQALGAGVMVARMALGPRHLMSINRGQPTPEIFEMLAGLVDLRDIALGADERLQLRTVWERQSFDALLPGLRDGDRRKLLELRPSLDAQFGVSRLTEYATVDIDELAQALEQSFPTDRAQELAPRIVSAARGNAEALRKLGFSV